MGWNASRVHLGSRTSVSFRRPLTNHSPVSPILYRSRRGFHRHSLIRGLLHTSLAMQSCREGSLLNIFVRERLKVSASIARRTSLTSHRGPTWTFEHFRVRSLRQRSHSFRRTAVTLLKLYSMNDIEDRKLLAPSHHSRHLPRPRLERLLHHQPLYDRHATLRKQLTQLVPRIRHRAD